MPRKWERMWVTPAVNRLLADHDMERAAARNVKLEASHAALGLSLLGLIVAWLPALGQVLAPPFIFVAACCSLGAMRPRKSAASRGLGLVALVIAGAAAWLAAMGN